LAFHAKKTPFSIILYAPIKEGISIGSQPLYMGIADSQLRLLTLAQDPPDRRVPFLPDFSLNGDAPQGLTYGVNL
jgi:hypothetical protein